MVVQHFCNCFVVTSTLVTLPANASLLINDCLPETCEYKNAYVFLSLLNSEGLQRAISAADDNKEALSELLTEKSVALRLKVSVAKEETGYLTHLVFNDLDACRTLSKVEKKRLRQSPILLVPHWIFGFLREFSAAYYSVKRGTTSVAASPILTKSDSSSTVFATSALIITSGCKTECAPISCISALTPLGVHSITALRQREARWSATPHQLLSWCITQPGLRDSIIADIHNTPTLKLFLVPVVVPGTSFIVLFCAKESHSRCETPLQCITFGLQRLAAGPLVSVPEPGTPVGTRQLRLPLALIDLLETVLVRFTQHAGAPPNLSKPADVGISVKPLRTPPPRFWTRDPAYPALPTSVEPLAVADQKFNDGFCVKKLLIPSLNDRTKVMWMERLFEELKKEGQGELSSQINTPNNTFNLQVHRLYLEEIDFVHSCLLRKICITQLLSLGIPVAPEHTLADRLGRIKTSFVAPTHLLHYSQLCLRLGLTAFCEKNGFSVVTTDSDTENIHVTLRAVPGTSAIIVLLDLGELHGFHPLAWNETRRVLDALCGEFAAIARVMRATLPTEIEKNCGSTLPRLCFCIIGSLDVNQVESNLGALIQEFFRSNMANMHYKPSQSLLPFTATATCRKSLLPLVLFEPSTTSLAAVKLVFFYRAVNAERPPSPTAPKTSAMLNLQCSHSKAVYDSAICQTPVLQKRQEPSTFQIPLQDLFYNRVSKETTFSARTRRQHVAFRLALRHKFLMPNVTEKQGDSAYPVCCATTPFVTRFVDLAGLANAWKLNYPCSEGTHVSCTKSLDVQDVALRNATEALKAGVYFGLEHSGLMRTVGLFHPPRVLLSGPSGSGKTRLLRRAAQEHPHIYSTTVCLTSLYSPFLGETERNIRKIFSRAHKKLPGILVLEGLEFLAESHLLQNIVPPHSHDNFPATGPQNKETNPVLDINTTRAVRPPCRNSDEFRRRLLTALLLCLDGVDSPTGSAAGLLGVIGVSRIHPEALEPALVRPGRLDRWIVLGNPNHESESGTSGPRMASTLPAQNCQKIRHASSGASSLASFERCPSVASRSELFGIELHSSSSSSSPTTGGPRRFPIEKPENCAQPRRAACTCEGLRALEAQVIRHQVLVGSLKILYLSLLNIMSREYSQDHLHSHHFSMVITMIRDYIQNASFVTIEGLAHAAALLQASFQQDNGER